jgi:single-stranded-DNA-specific exonuclease
MMDVESPGNADIKGFQNAAQEAAECIAHASHVKVIGHIDADGITAASIATIALERAHISCEVRFVKKLDEQEIASINDGKGLAWLVDLGSGSFSKFSKKDLVITDHHRPEISPKKASGQIDLLSFLSTHVNPHLYGIDGALEVSGAGTTYCVARAMDERNRDLATLGVVGAVGDLQDSRDCCLIGFNRSILRDAREHGGMLLERDLRLFGRETRPVAKMLQYSSDPFLPGLTNNQDGCFGFLQDLGIEPKEGDEWRHWVDLSPEEKRSAVSALANLLLDSGRSFETIKRLVGEVYLLGKEKARTELHDAKEYATLLNACGRYGKAPIGREICAGNRSEFLQRAVALQQNHRENLADAINLVKDLGLERGEYIQHFHGHDLIIDSIVGIVAGMVLGSGEIPSDLPIVAFANAIDDRNKVKVSARGTRDQVNRGLDLAVAVKLASEKVGGVGGGHNIAAGATIDCGKEEAFLLEIEKLIREQMSGPSPSA